jgi:hypothetical protein
LRDLLSHNAGPRARAGVASLSHRHRMMAGEARAGAAHLAARPRLQRFLISGIRPRRSAAAALCFAGAAVRAAIPHEEKLEHVPMKTSRRSFLITSVGAVSALALSSREAFAAPMLAETDPTAAALGYKADATKVDKSKFPKYAAGQDCAACSMYQGKKGSTSAACVAFPGKDVAAKGWCSAFSKMA